MKNFFIILFIFTVFLTSFVKAIDLKLEVGKWNFSADKDYCIIGSYPTTKDVPEGKKRGKTFVLVYRLNKDSNAIIEIRAGYPYDEKKSVEVKIDQTFFEFYSQDDSAWTDKDKDVIYAMKKGIEMTIQGYSSRGTLTTDIYTLKGFTAAYNKLFNIC